MNGLTLTACAAALRGLHGVRAVQEQAAVGRYTTWKVGGPAALLCTATSEEGLTELAALLQQADFPWLLIGRGSNLLFVDEGFAGLVILNRADQLIFEGTLARAESGVLLSVLARRSVETGLEGVEWSHDIPGSVGGAVVNNAGAHGGCIADILLSARIIDATGAVRELENHELQFSYRHSILRSEGRVATSPRPLVLSAVLQLQAAPDLEGVRRRLAAQRAQRKATQPGGASAGSVFKNPPGESAGRLVESVGLKGRRHGGAFVSPLHANFIGAEAGAIAHDVLSLIATMQQEVQERYGMTLEPEVQVVYRDGQIGPPHLMVRP